MAGVLTADRTRALAAAALIPAVAARRALLATFLGFGGFIGLFAGAVPTVTRLGGIDNQTLGWCFTIFTLAGITTQALGSRLGRWFSPKSILLTLFPVGVFAIALLMAARSGAAFAAALVGFGIVTALIDLYMNSEATILEETSGRPLMTVFHGCVSLNIALFAVISSVLAAEFGPLSTMPVAIAIGLITSFVISRLLRDGPSDAASQRSASHVPIARSQLIRLAGHGLSLGLVTAAETSAIFWAAKLFADHSSALSMIAGAATAFFAGFQAAARFAGDSLRKYFGDLSLLIGSIFVATAGCLSIGVFDNAIVRAFALAIFGVGVGAIVPIILAAIGREMGDARVRGIGISAAVSGVPRTVLPWIFGLIAAGSSIAHGFLAASVCLVLALVIVLVLNAQSSRNAQPPLRNPF